jgi:magnesium chelatase subunit D
MGNDSSTMSTEQLHDEIVAAVASVAIQMNTPDVKSLDRRIGGVSGRFGELGLAYDRGRPDRLVRYQPGRGRVDVLATLRAAAPMQRIRGRTSPDQRLQLRMEDLRTKRFKRRKQCSVIFVVDASGSSAMHRMAEAKGAVESLLSQCYARRDLVSLVAFSGVTSKIVLRPTRSLVRAQREITDLSGGGATPLAHAVATAAELAHLERSRGRTPFLVFMSDGRGNISLQGEPDRAASTEQVRGLARRYIYGMVQSLYFDISRRPDARSKGLSDDLGAQYEFLPIANAGRVSELVRERIGSR